MNAPNFSSMTGSVVYAVPATGVGGPCSGRPHDLAVPGEADHGRGDKEIVRTVRCHAEAGWLHRHVGSDRRCQPGCGAASAQCGRREEGDQGGPYTAELEGQAGQAAAQGSRRALDGQIHQGQTARGWLKTPPVDLAIPLFGYQNHVAIDRRFGFIRRWAATDAAAYEGRRLRQGLLDSSNTASGVWADTAHRSAANETFLTKNGFVSHIHRKKPKGRAMPETMRRADNAKSKIRSRVEHAFAEQKDRMELFIRTIGIARATTKIGMANLVYNIKRFIFLRKIAVA